MSLEYDDQMAGSEARNHTPTELCPHPEYWHAWNPYSTEVEVSMLVAAFVRAMQPDFVVEIGAHVGQTTERIGRALYENGHGMGISLEIDQEFYKIASERVPPMYPVVVLQEDSLIYVPAHTVELLFVDGHEANRAADVKHFTQYLSPHAVVICHDMDYYLDEKEKILKDWEGEHISLHTPRGLLILTR